MKAKLRLVVAARAAGLALALLAAYGCTAGPQGARVQGRLPEAAKALEGMERGDLALALAAGATDTESAELVQPASLATEAIVKAKPPELLARLEGPDLQALPFAAHDVVVVIVGHRARVVFDMVFANPTEQTLAGTLMVGLPDRASPCYLATFEASGPPMPATSADAVSPALLAPDPAGPEAVLAQSPALARRWDTPRGPLDWGREQAARVVESAKGREVYEAVTRRRVDPALAEWAGAGAFSTRIYPIAPGSTKRVIFAYDQTLPPTQGRVAFALPSPSSAAAARRMTVYELGGQFSRATVSASGAALPVEQAAGVRTWRPALPAGDSGAAGVLAFEGFLRTPGLSVLAGVDAAVPGTLATLAITPELPPRPLVSATGRALFALDTSASGRSGLYRLAGQMLRRILESDDSISEFAIVAFDVRATLLTPGFVANTPEARGRYLSDVERVRLEGATNLAALAQYLAGRPELAKADTCFLLSDGEITWGTDDPAALLAGGLGSKPWICYAFGGAPHNEQLFAALARAGGRVVQVGPAQDLAEAARAHREPLRRLEWVRSPAQDEVIVAGRPSLLYPGQVLEIAVRTLRPVSELRLAMRIDGRDYEVKTQVSSSPLTDALAARAWAEAFVADLAGERDEAAQRVTLEMSRHFRLANDVASFLILETEEDYKRYGVEDRPLDFRAIRQTLAARSRPAAGERFVLAGLAVPAEMPEDTVQLLRSLAALPRTPVWEVPVATEAAWSPRLLLQAPRFEPVAQTPHALYAAARALRGEGQPPQARAETPKPDPALEAAQALRVLSGIAELAPRDDRALRLVGFALIGWGYYEEAAEVFGRVRARRPFEPQNLLLEAIAQGASGAIGAAALRCELVLAGTFPRFEDEARPVAARLYADLLRAALASHANHPHAAAWRKRLGMLETEEPALAEPPAGRLLLFWNLDDTDVDLHVREGAFTEVWYKNMSSQSGGRLFWDNTEGLGPELYEHPTLSRSGFQVTVDYFGSSSVEGEAPAATFVVAFTRSKPGAVQAGFYTTVLLGSKEDRVQIMPVWRIQ